MFNQVKYLLVVAAVTAINSANANTCNSANDRIEFKKLLITLSDESQIKSLNCQERTNGAPPTAAQYSFTLEKEPNYKDAFFLNFKSAKEWSTLVAYDGPNGYVLGCLSRTDNPDSIVFDYGSHGVSDEALQLTVSNGKVSNLTFTKDGSYELRCP